MNQLGHFEENLLTELREVVAAQATAVAPRPVRPHKRLVLATAGAGLVAAGVVVGIPAMNGEQAAYAVTNNDDGTVTITVNRLEDPDGLERELAGHGITADVDFLPPGKRCQSMPERFQRKENPVLDVFVGVSRGDGPLTLRSADAEGKTLILVGTVSPWATDPAKQFEFHYSIVSGPVTPCVVVE